MSELLSPPSMTDRLPPLENGDELTREEFERRYDAMPHLKKAELIEGVVHMPSPIRYEAHSHPHNHLSAWTVFYEAFTPGVGSGNASTVRIDSQNEPQPDVLLFIKGERGNVRISSDDYLEGPPELVIEISSSTVSIDSGKKKNVYRRNGVKEYLLWRVEQGEIDWFILRSGNYEKLIPDEAGIIKSETFPGLWLDVKSLLQQNMAVVITVLQEGLASQEHQDFVTKPPQKEESQ